MLPQFDESGWLPPGVHPATLDEIAERFGRDSEIGPRPDGVDSMDARSGQNRWNFANRPECSFVTDTIDPNDVDCVLLVDPRRKRDRSAFAELRAGLPFLDMKLVAEDEFLEYVNIIYRTDRLGVPKGVVEVIEWN